MFVDMRGSSRLAERRLPFDTVFIINQFLNAVSGAVTSAGGEPNQVLGDGLLALFGLTRPARRAAGRRSLPAPRSQTRREPQQGAGRGSGEPIRFGIGIQQYEEVGSRNT